MDRLKKSSRLAEMAVLGAGIAWGIIALFIKPLAALGLTSMQITGVRLTTGALVMLPVMLARHPEKLKIDLKDLWIFVLSGTVCTVLYAALYIYATVHGETSVAIVLLYTSPVFVVLMSALVFHEKISRAKLLAIILTVAGCVFVSGVLHGVSSITPLVIITGIGSGFFYALYTIVARVAMQKYESLTVTTYTLVFAMLGILPLCDLPATLRMVPEYPEILVRGFGIGICCMFLPVFLFNWGLEKIEAGKAAILVALEPVVGVIIGMTVFRESHDVLKMAGIIMVIAAILIVNRDNT